MDSLKYLFKSNCAEGDFFNLIYNNISYETHIGLHDDISINVFEIQEEAISFLLKEMYIFYNDNFNLPDIVKEGVLVYVTINELDTEYIDLLDFEFYKISFFDNKVFILPKKTINKIKNF